MSNVNNLEKIVNDFFEELQEAYNSGCLTIKKQKKLLMIVIYLKIGKRILFLE